MPVTTLLRRPFRGKVLSDLQHNDVREILRDIESLDGHTAFLFNKINFLMDATDSAININQNKDIKRLTILSVVFMPINVLAGMGGMSEFSMMTQGIPWPIAYSVLSPPWSRSADLPMPVCGSSRIARRAAGATAARFDLRRRCREVPQQQQATGARVTRPGKRHRQRQWCWRCQPRHGLPKRSRLRRPTEQSSDRHRACRGKTG